MNWLIRWQAIRERIHGLSAAASYLFKSLAHSDGDAYGAFDTFIIPSALSVVRDVQTLAKDDSREISLATKAIFERFGSTIDDFVGGLPPKGANGAQLLVTAIVCLGAELDQHTAGVDAIATSICDRAFIHLSRLLVVDGILCARWKEAFEKNERACEKLGAVHLLGHGIWSFKTDAAGERTDLVLGEPLRVTPQVRRASTALVLTEWKLVRTPTELSSQADQALRQARRYSAGILSGFELSGTRYVVLVSNDVLPAPPDVAENGVLYRFVVVAVSPSVPSLARSH